MKTTLEVLVAARVLIHDPEHWCRGAFAMDADGAGGEPKVVAPEDDKACRWNPFGAVRRAGGLHVMFQLTKPEIALNKIARQLGFTCVEELNNTRPHAEVLALFDQAIAELRG